MARFCLRGESDFREGPPAEKSEEKVQERPPERKFSPVLFQARFFVGKLQVTFAE
jgi:hypothetical protein